MNLTIEEFEQLVELLERPVIVTPSKEKSIDIRVACKKGSEVLTRPLEFCGEKITQIGVYSIKGFKLWVVKE